MADKERLLYEPRPLTDPKPDSWTEYDIADVNPKWIKDILGDHWEYYRSPQEIRFSANAGTTVDGAIIATSIRFTPEMLHVSSLDTTRGKGVADPSLELYEPGKVKFPSNFGNEKTFEVMTRVGEQL